MRASHPLQSPRHSKQHGSPCIMEARAAILELIVDSFCPSLLCSPPLITCSQAGRLPVGPAMPRLSHQQAIAAAAHQMPHRCRRQFAAALRRTRRRRPCRRPRIADRRERRPRLCHRPAPARTRLRHRICETRWTKALQPEAVRYAAGNDYCMPAFVLALLPRYLLTSLSLPLVLM